HNAHVTMLQQMLGANASPIPSFQNLDAADLNAFLTQAQAIEDFDVSVHQGVILSVLPGVSTSTGTTGTGSTGTGTTGTGTTGTGTTGTGTTGTGTTGTGTGTSTGTTAEGQGIFAVEVAILADDARNAGAIRAYRKLASTAEGGDPNTTISENGSA